MQVWVGYLGSIGGNAHEQQQRRYHLAGTPAPVAAAHHHGVLPRTSARTRERPVCTVKIMCEVWSASPTRTLAPSRCSGQRASTYLGVGAKEGRRVLAEGYYVGQDTGRMGYTKRPQRDTAVDSSCARCMYVYVYLRMCVNV